KDNKDKSEQNQSKPTKKRKRQDKSGDLKLLLKPDQPDTTRRKQMKVKGPKLQKMKVVYKRGKRR
ncbi:hypothetical protein Tco_0135863, partial [Tanacetum coccineum]